MINSAPRQSNKYKQGLYTPNNKDKVVKLNSQGGLYYRSGLEQKMMIYLDMNENIINWGAEHLRVPYSKTEWISEKQEFKTSEHGIKYFSSGNLFKFGIKSLKSLIPL